MDRFKCYNCFLVFDQNEMIEDMCPGCGTNTLIKQMCKNDTGVCKCAHDTHPSIKLCDLCNEPMCPECGSHDAVGVSRVKLEKIRSF